MATAREIVVTKTLRVNAPLAVAFDVFVGQEWWPVDTHHLADPHGSEVVLEPFPGGRWYERATDGTETDWGTVLAWQLYDRAQQLRGGRRPAGRRPRRQLDRAGEQAGFAGRTLSRTPARPAKGQVDSPGHRKGTQCRRTGMASGWRPGRRPG
jgi:hypothetical protein